MEIMMIENAPLTMSSREIAELTGKRHDHVLRDIKNMLTNLYGEDIKEQDIFDAVSARFVLKNDSPKLGNEQNQGVTIIRDNRGYVSEIRLDRSHTMTLVTGYDARLRKSVIDRMDELEKQVAKPADPMAILNDPASLRGLLGNYAERVQSLENKVAEQQPKADGFDRIANADGGMNLTNAAKSLDIQPKIFFAWLVANRWIYRRAGGKSYVAFQDKIRAGYLKHKVYAVTLDNGDERISEQVIVTPKGLAKLALLAHEIKAEAQA
ncbi:MAG: phage regulatory protein/antirepressor Ant [Alistipes senegalensis]|nr:phage regulatory protein/antirepressor Ant [Oxalobacter formigenes]MCM1280923.1 phage regulatory protein/antirepressor Ant [Alistipes senegalensis]